MSQVLPKDVPQTLRRWKRYATYKDAGGEWLGEIPAHWKTGVRLTHLAKKERHSFVNGPFGSDLLTSEITETGVPVIYIRDLTPNKYSRVSQSCVTEQKAKQLSAFQTSPGDVLIAKVGDPPGVATVYPENEPLGIVTQDVIRIKPDEQVVLSEYLAYVLNSNFMGAIIDQISVASTRTRISLGDFKQIRLFTPPLSEQQAIASFLDRETAKIDALIAKKERLIELLQEKRTAIISHAVTKGLDPTALLKDSGVEWLGEVPAHWKVLSVRRLAGMIEQGWSPVAEDRLASEDEWGVIKLSAVNQGLFRPEEHKTLPEDMEADKRYEIKAGDFLLTRANTPNLVGDVCVVLNTRRYLMLCDLVYRVSVDDNRVSKNYLCYWFLCRAGRYQITRDARGSSLSMVKVSQNSIRSWLVALPPFLEQQAIASYLDRETTKIDALIAKIREDIEKLKEYRTALISAAVTGKIDVCNEVAS